MKWIVSHFELFSGGRLANDDKEALLGGTPCVSIDRIVNKDLS